MWKDYLIYRNFPALVTDKSVLDYKVFFIASSWWRLRRGGPIITAVPQCHLIFRRPGLPKTALHSFTCSLAHTSPSGTHRERERALSLFNPHYSRGADSIWWVSGPCSVHFLHSPAPTHLLSSIPCDYGDYFIPFLRSWRNQRVVAPVMDICRYGWMDRCSGCIVMDRQHDISALLGVKVLC